MFVFMFDAGDSWDPLHKSKEFTTSTQWEGLPTLTHLSWSQVDMEIAKLTSQPQSMIHGISDVAISVDGSRNH